MSKNDAVEMPGVIAATGTKRNRLVAQLSEYQGERLLNLRRWYLDKRTNEWIPTKKGVSLSARAYSFLVSVIQEFGDDILDWLGIDGSANHEGREKSIQSRHAPLEATVNSQKYVVESAEWSSPEPFAVAHEGGSAVLYVNVKTELGRRVMEAHISSGFNEERGQSGVGLLFSYVVAQSQAKALFDTQDEYEAGELFELHSWNVGLLVNRMVHRDE